MSRFIDLTRKTFGRLLVLNLWGRTKRGQAIWWCRCVCGNEKPILGYSLSNGDSQSCGCLHKEKMTKHGQHKKGERTSEYTVWDAMMQRCANSKHKSWKRYGGRGIKVCDRWHDFQNFYIDMGPRPSSKYWIERRDNDGDYCPENCYWATTHDQSRNRCSNSWLTAFEETKIVSDWNKELEIGHSTIQYHLERGKTMEWIVNHFRERKAKKRSPK
jgi:hypothetical protein